MPDEAGDKTEQPTPRRREEAREEGQIARSVDLTAAISTLAALLLLRFFGPGMMDALLVMTRSLGDKPALTGPDLLPWIERVGIAAAKALAPFLVFLMVLTAVGAVAQSGLLLTWKRVGFKLDRLDPVSGFKRVFSSEALNRLGQSVFKITLLTAIAYFAIRGRIREVIAIGGSDPGGVYVLGVDLVFTLALQMAVVLLILGIIDYLFQRWKLEKKLRMTKQEVRDELKRMEGDPLLKQRRRQMQRRMAMQRINAEVPRADVVVTNPTEFAVALRYDESTMPAPRVVAKGKGFLAERIRQVAQQHGVPIVERPPLARALYAAVEVGQEVPPAFYRAVAELLAYVYQLSRRAG